MLSKTDRILGYLPPTFRALPPPTALYSVVNAFGTQLQEAEKSLGAVMLSHWVDYADRGSQFITDLNCFAALYGLAPRGAAKDVAQFAGPTCAPVSADETVEEFREHLKRYVRTFIEGPVTVQGILRVAAEALGIHIADDYASMDTWWTREDGYLTTTLPRSDSVTQQLFGVTFARAHGSAALPAQVIGRTNLQNGIELHGASILRLLIDQAPPVEIDLTDLGVTTTLDHVIAAINRRLSATIASDSEGCLKLASPSFGANSRLEVPDGDRDAAPALLGLLPRTYKGRIGTAATVTGQVDLSKGVDLGASSFIQLSIDNASPIAIDCVGMSRAKTTLSQVVDAINKTVRKRIAGHDGLRLTLVSPSKGSTSSIRFMPLSAADATESIFGIAPRTFQGTEATAARIAGSAGLKDGVDLRAHHLLQVSMDGGPSVEVDLWTAAEDLQAVSATKIRNTINRALGAGIAWDDGNHLFLSSEVIGPASSIAVGPATVTQTRRFVTRAYITDEAAPVILGFLSRFAVGSAATPATLLGAVDLSGGVDLRANHFLRIAVNGRAAKEVDLAKGVALPRGATLPEIVNAINSQVGFAIASARGNYLSLTSPTTGASSYIGLEPAPTKDARLLLFGPNRTKATGKDPGPATIVGDVMLPKPISLGDRQTLRLAVDNQPALDADVAGAAPSSTSLDEIIAKINSIFPGIASATPDQRLRLTSPTVGEASALDLLPLRAIEVMEYPPTPVEEKVREVQHGDHWYVDNDGACTSDLEFQVVAPQGGAGVQFVDRAAGTRLRVLDAILPGETMQIRRGGGNGVQVEIMDVKGNLRSVPDSSVLAGTLASEVEIPFEGQHSLTLSAAAGQPATLQLNNPSAPAVVVLRALAQQQPGDRILVSVIPSGSLPSKVNPTEGQQTLVGRMQGTADQCYLLDASSKPTVRLLSAPSTMAANGLEPIVAVAGTVYVDPGSQPIMAVESTSPLFDVTVHFDSQHGPSLMETYEQVTIGLGATPESLPLALLTRPSQLLRAEEMNKADFLIMPRGTLELTYMTSHVSRFDQVKFASSSAKGGESPQTNEARFAGGIATDWAIFDTGRFSEPTGSLEMAFFAPAQPDASVQVGVHWTRHQLGAFEVNLPADLAPEFGARFDQARFGLPAQKPETYNGVVTEPITNPNWIVNRVNARSTLVSASRYTGTVPLGWQPAVMPFEQPRSRTLSGATANEPARMYLVEEGVPNAIELRALQKGPGGNSISVTSKASGPARFDMTIDYQGARFENARQVALAGRILGTKTDAQPTQTAQIISSGPVGLTRAKAAGVRVDVTRDRTDVPGPALDTELSRLRSPRPGYPHLAFNGLNSYIEAPDSDQFSVSTSGELTVSAWMRPDTLTFPHHERGYVYWLGKGEGVGSQGHQEWAFRMYNFDTQRPNRISFYLFNPWGGLGIGSYFQDSIDPGEWIHVVGAADGARTYIYKNGECRGCDQYRQMPDHQCTRHPFTITPVNGPVPLRMGHVYGQSYFLGGLSEVRIWNRLLNKKEVAGLYGSNKAPQNGLVAEYLLNEGSGDVAHDTVGNNDATIFNAKWK